MKNGSATYWGAESLQVDTRWVQFAAYPKENITFPGRQCFNLFHCAKGTGVNCVLMSGTQPDTCFADAIQINDSVLVLAKDNHIFYNFAIDTTITSADTLSFESILVSGFIFKTPNIFTCSMLLSGAPPKANLWRNPPTVTTRQ
jgi:hypothetical protein